MESPDFLNKIEVTTVLDDVPLLAGEFSYNDENGVLSCGFFSDTWKGVSTAEISLRIEPIPPMMCNVYVKGYDSVDVNASIKPFPRLNYSIDVQGYSGTGRINIAFRPLGSLSLELNVDGYTGKIDIETGKE